MSESLQALTQSIQDGKRKIAKKATEEALTAELPPS